MNENNELTSFWYDIFENKVVRITVAISGTQDNYVVDLLEVIVQPHYCCYIGDWEETNDYDNVIKFHIERGHYRREIEKAFII